MWRPGVYGTEEQIFPRIVGLQHQVPPRPIERLAGRIDRRLGR
jgi:hypothetical protein